MNFKFLSMITGGIIATGSVLMYSIGKFVFDNRVKLLENAPEITEYGISEFVETNDKEFGTKLQEQSNTGIGAVYGYVQGPLFAEKPIEHQKKLYIRLDECIYHITTTKVIGYEYQTLHKNGDKGEKVANWQRKCEFVHRTANQVKPILINNVNIGVFIKSIPLKEINTSFQPVHDYIQNQGHSNKINIINSNSNQSDIIGEHDREVIGVEKRYKGIKCGKIYTIYGEYDPIKNKMKKSHTQPNIVTKQTRDEFIESEKDFANGWKIFWGAAFVLGSGICTVGVYLDKYN